MLAERLSGLQMISSLVERNPDKVDVTGSTPVSLQNRTAGQKGMPGRSPVKDGSYLPPAFFFISIGEPVHVRHDD